MTQLIDHSYASCLQFAALFKSTNNSLTTPVDMRDEDNITDGDLERYFCLEERGMQEHTCRDFDIKLDACGECDEQVQNSCIASNYYSGYEDCEDGEFKRACMFYRFLSVTCSEESGSVSIRIQSGGTPDYCWNTSWSENVASAHSFDVTVSWNLSVSEITDNNIKHWEANTSQEVTDILCKTTGTSWENAPTPIDLTLGVTFLSETYLPDTLVGFALNGVPFVQALDSNNEDMLYPLEVGGTSRPDDLTL